MKKIIITGGTGIIGKKITDFLVLAGYKVVILTRYPKENNHCYWNVEKQEIDEEVLRNTYGLIHLAGENIGKKRWTKSRKEEILDSRTKSLLFLYDKFQKLEDFPEVVISSSAVGYYGAITSETNFKEESQPYNDFLGQLCFQWEQVALKFQEKSRVVILRTAVVISKEKNGALHKMLQPFKYGVGAVLGKGKQYFPWIHIEDIAELYIYCLQNNKLSGVFNAVAPEHITNYEFSKQLALIVAKPLWLPPIPEFMLKLLLGEMAEMLTEGSRISSEKIEKQGYKFKFPLLRDALKDILE